MDWTLKERVAWKVQRLLQPSSPVYASAELEQRVETKALDVGGDLPVHGNKAKDPTDRYQYDSVLPTAECPPRAWQTVPGTSRSLTPHNPPTMALEEFSFHR